MQAIKRNLKRFPGDFMFQLAWEEVRLLQSESAALKKQSDTASRSQFVTLKKGKNIKYLPYAFTGQAVAMLSSVLTSKRAVQLHIAIMRSFVHLREMLASHKDLTRKAATVDSVGSSTRIEGAKLSNEQMGTFLWNQWFMAQSVVFP
jgi:hypothetical protein